MNLVKMNNSNLQTRGIAGLYLFGENTIINKPAPQAACSFRATVGLPAKRHLFLDSSGWIVVCF